METKKQNYTLPIIVMIFLFGMISFVTNLASPMGDILKYQFNVPNWMGTLGVFANFIAYAIMGYPAGNMLQKYGYKKTALIAIAVGFTGVGIQTLSGSVESFGVYLLGAFIAGFSMCLLNTVVNPMLNKRGGGGNKGNQLIQAGGSFNSLCGTAVIILTGIVGSLLGETVCKICRITDPLAKGLALGTSAHAIGTSKALQMGEIEGAMSGLAIAVAGIMTAILAPVAANFLP